VTLTKLKFMEIEKNGFGLVDAILSLSLLAGIITYGIYFSSMRLNIVHSSNLIRSINKEIERDIERLKLDLWSLNYNKNTGNYIFNQDECEDSTDNLLDLPSWNISANRSTNQSWRPGPERSKVFTGQKVLISRELVMTQPLNNQSLNNSVATINYRVQWGEKDEHWLSIDLAAESHSWCEQQI